MRRVRPSVLLFGFPQGVTSQPMLRPGQRSRACTILASVLVTIVALLLPLGFSPRLLHEHGASGHHVHALAIQGGSFFEERNAWHVQQHEHEQHGPAEPTGEGREPVLRPVSDGFLLHIPGSWIQHVARDHARLIQLGLCFRSPATVEWSEERRVTAVQRGEWPPPRGEPFGVLALLRKSHVLLI